MGVFNLLSTIKDNLYTILSGSSYECSSAIFLLAKPGHRLMLKNSAFTFDISRFKNASIFFEDKNEFEILNEYLEQYNVAEFQYVNFRSFDSDLDTIFDALGIRKIEGNILNAINKD